MSPTSFEYLDRKQRRRLATRSALRIVISTAILLGIYALVPAAGESGARAVFGLIAGLLVFGVLLAWQVRSIVGAEHPEFRAAEALAVAIPVLIIVFAFTYLSLSHANAASFSERLDHVGAMYFTITVIGTVGFGDIAAKSDIARVIVSIQILLDLGVLVGLVRTIAFAARVGVRRQYSDRMPSESGDGA